MLSGLQLQSFALVRSLFFVRGLSQSIDFTGGRNYVVTLDKQTPVEEVRKAMAGAFINTIGEKANQEANTSVIALGTVVQSSALLR